MSQVKIQGNASGTGIFTVASPNSNTDRTLTLPDQTGTVLTNAGPFTANASASAGAVTIDASNNVGIGTSSPGAKLDVAGGAALFAKGSANGITIGDVSTNSNAVLRLQGTSAGRNWQIANNLNVGGLEFTPSATNGGTTFTTPAVAIDSSGNLLVGTTNAGLNSRGVNSNVFKNQTSQDTLGLNQSSNSYYNLVSVVSTTSGTRYHVGFGDGNGSYTERGSISTNGTSTSYTTTSDYRLKENIQPMQNALAKVAALKPCTYTWKSNGSDGEGFIAHELQEVVPQCVSGEKDAVNEDGKPVYQGIDTSFLVATLTAAIQELKAELDAVKVELATLKGAAS